MSKPRARAGAIAVAACSLILAGTAPSVRAGTAVWSGELLALAEQNADVPVVVHYGLNDSHSRSWAQIDSSGVVGISYFRRLEDSRDTGALIYKTIQPDGSARLDEVTTGTHLEKSVLLLDSSSSPHIFVAQSSDLDQTVDHYSKRDDDGWQRETIVHFRNEGGKFIYELSADVGPDDSFHLLILKTRSNIDSDDFWDAWLGSHLYHLTNASGAWEKELIAEYNMPYTWDVHIKSSSRQDIKVDDAGYVHVAFGEQVHTDVDASRLLYATNKTGQWVIETALSWDHGPYDDAGWFPSLSLDGDGLPHISCMYVSRVATASARYSKLLLLKRSKNGEWRSQTVAEFDDGYYGSDGRDYTGALSHLVIDRDDDFHIIFSDVASSHWDYNRLNVGNIRYAKWVDGAWKVTTLYRQPLPTGFYSATEMYGMCLLLSEESGAVYIVGQEMKIAGENQYTTRLVELGWEHAARGPIITSVKAKTGEPGSIARIKGRRFGTKAHKVRVHLGTKKAELVGECRKRRLKFEIPKMKRGIYELYVMVDGRSSNRVDFEVR